MVILGFAWSFSLYINQESPTINVNSKNNLSENTNKIKLFENYSNQTLRIAVLNGCGISGVGNSYGNILTNRYGLQVTRIENADNFNYEMTMIVILSKDNPNIENESAYNKELMIGWIFHYFIGVVYSFSFFIPFKE